MKELAVKCHLALMKISESGGKVFAYEAPDRSISKILGYNGDNRKRSRFSLRHYTCSPT
jgi:hypothetical protein